MKNETERSNKNNNIIQETSVAQDIVQLLLKIAFIILAVFLIFTFLYGIVRINDVSMKPAIKDGDLVMYYRLDKRFISGDVAVFEADGRTTTGRVVAVAGDTVDITKNGLKIMVQNRYLRTFTLIPPNSKMEWISRSQSGAARYLYLEITGLRHRTAEFMAALI